MNPPRPITRHLVSAPTLPVVAAKISTHPDALLTMPPDHLMTRVSHRHGREQPEFKLWDASHKWSWQRPRERPWERQQVPPVQPEVAPLRTLVPGLAGDAARYGRPVGSRLVSDGGRQ